ncbi:MAG: hypothetical protein QXU99_01840 [Candidatus Bathyarchaeia archaeon]
MRLGNPQTALLSKGCLVLVKIGKINQEGEAHEWLKYFKPLKQRLSAVTFNCRRKHWFFV